MADYHEIPAEEMPDPAPDTHADPDVYAVSDESDYLFDEVSSADEQPSELEPLYGGWSLSRLFVLMLVLVVIAVLLMQLLIPAAYQVLYPPPIPTLRPPWMA